MKLIKKVKSNEIFKAFKHGKLAAKYFAYLVAANMIRENQFEDVN